MSEPVPTALGPQLLDQVDGHWRQALRPRLEGLTDEEYLWEPVPGCWTVRPAGTGTPGLAQGDGPFTVDFAVVPQGDPAPVTTIAWRLVHVVVGVLLMRVHGHFGGPAVAYETFPYAPTAAEALAQLDEAYDAWTTGVRSWDDAALARPCGPSEGPFAAFPRSAIVLHINRELIHHGAEICLLRDLFAHQAGI